MTHYTEPRQLKWNTEEVRKFHSSFDLILTNEETLLDLNNARFALFGGSWVKQMPKKKIFEISFLYSNGIGAEHLFKGYQDRRTIWNLRQEIKIPTQFWTSTKRPPENITDANPYPFAQKEELFNSMFSIIVENEYQPHFFTEKIIDCLRSYSVPIYLGAPNIDKYFDISGIIKPESADNLINLIQHLTPADYWNRIEAMHKNFKESQKYWNLLENLHSYILSGYQSTQSNK